VTAWGGMTPRRWQAEALDALRVALRTSDAALVRACTGSGKSLLISEIVAGVLSRGRRCLISVPSVDLVRQLSATVAARVGAENVGRYYTDAKQPDRPCVIVCLPSLNNLLSTHPAWDVWIMDEAHRVESDTGRIARDIAQVGKRVGLTATPFRSDRRGLLGWPAGDVYTYLPEDAIRDGVLVPFRIKIPELSSSDPLAKDIGKLDAVCADFVKKQNKPGIVNAVSIADAEAFAKYLRQRDLPAEAVHSGRSSKENAKTLESLRVGALRAVVHVNLLQEGIDLPWLHFLVMRKLVGKEAEDNGRPSVRFVQEAGRILRTYPGKTEAIFFDPHNQFVRWHLSPDATFEDLENAAAEPDPEPEAEQQGGGQPRQVPPEVVIRGPLMVEIQRLYRECLSLGFAEPTRAYSSFGATSSQLETIAKAFSKHQRHVSQPLRGWLEDDEIWNRLTELTRSDASALISVLWNTWRLTPNGADTVARAAK